LKYAKLYIPHGSDESYLSCRKDGISKQLYIPHGSDESDEEKTTNNVLFIFISHMVQMKVTIAGVPFQSQYSLYPTWFR